jgi:hypothetical protein
MVVNSRDPGATIRRGWKVRENRGVFDRNLLLIIITIRDPGLYLSAIKGPRDQPLMEGMLVVIALLADGIQPGEKARAGRAICC